MTDDLIAFLHQQFENQRFRAESLKTLAFALPPETGAYLTETGELLLAEVDAKRRILDEHNDPISDGRTLRPGGETVVCGTCHQFGNRDEHQPWPCTTLRLLALPSADRPGYRAEWAVAPEGAGTI